MKSLETKRLFLRPFQESDLEDFYNYAKLETVGPNAGWMPHPNREHSRAILEKFIEADDVLAMYHKNDQLVIGSIGLHKRVLDGYGEVHELGYVMSTAYERQGLMTEAVKEVLRYAFEDLNLEDVFVAHFIENDKSKKLIERVGFNYIKNIEYLSRDYGLKISRLYSMANKNIKFEEEK